MSDQGAVYSAFIAEAVEHERKRRDALDARGLAVITTVSGFLTLLVATVVLVVGKDRVLTSRVSVACVLVGFVAFLAAGVLGLLAHRLRKYAVPDGDGYRTLLIKRWRDTEPTARNAVSLIGLKMLLSLRDGNNKKANQLQLALVFQLVGIVAVAIGTLWQATHS